MQKHIVNKLKKQFIFVLIFIIIYTILSFLPLTTNKSYAATYTYTANSNDLPANFEQKYPGYIALVQSLVSSHPNWTFKLYETGLEWEETIINEYQGHGKSPKNLSPSNYPIGWICAICGNQKYDNGGWSCASKESIEYMMDPRNSINESDIFQFQDLSSSEGDKNAVKKMISGSFFDNEQCLNSIMEAAKEYNISPYHLASRIIQEQGKNGSTLGLGITVEGGYKVDETGRFAILTPKEAVATGTNVEKDGKEYVAITLGDVNGDGKVKATDYMKIKNHIMGSITLSETERLAADVNEDGNIKATDYMKIKSYIMENADITIKNANGGKKYYNLFNIGAYGNTISQILENGLQRAKQEGWTSMASSIKGGAKFLANRYIAVGQKTLYYQKFNVVNKESLYGHQYMQNVLAAQNEGVKIRKEYESNGILNQYYVFEIPLYSNMPKGNCPKATNLNPNAKGLMKIIANGGLNLRKAPNSNAQTIGTINRGTIVKELEVSGEWYKVLTPKGIGYMHGDYLFKY